MLWITPHSRYAPATFASMRPLSPLQLLATTETVAQVKKLRAAGTPHWRLYASDQARVVYGVVPATGVDPHSFEARLAAARLLFQEGTFLSRRTAARLCGFPVDGGESTIDIGSIQSVKPPIRSEFTAHRVRAQSLLYLPGPPLWLPHPTDIWALLGAVSSVRRLVIIGDHMVSGPSRKDPAVATLDDLGWAVKRHAGVRGIARLREALPLIRTGVESPAETNLRLLITRSGFPEPVTSCPVPTALMLFRADLGYPDFKIAIEHEGEYHFMHGVEQARKDLLRYEAMQDAGWIVLRTTALDLREPRFFLSRLAAARQAALAR